MQIAFRSFGRSATSLNGCFRERYLEVFKRIDIRARGTPNAFKRLITAWPPFPMSKATAMPAAHCELNPAIREFLASLPPGTVIAQLADGSLAVCRSEDEADRQIVASRGGKCDKPLRKSRSLEPNRTVQQPAVRQPGAG